MIELVLRFHGADAANMGTVLDEVTDLVDGSYESVEVVPLDAIKMGWDLAAN